MGFGWDFCMKVVGLVRLLDRDMILVGLGQGSRRVCGSGRDGRREWVGIRHW